MNKNKLTMKDLHDKILHALIENDATYKEWNDIDKKYDTIPYTEWSELDYEDILEGYDLGAALDAHHYDIDDGNNITSIIKIKGDDNFYRVDCQYCSYGGYDFYNAEVRIVKLKKVELTVYE